MKNILVVEDNPDNMALMEEILEDEGFAVLKAETAEKGIEALANTSVDLILMDISLPKMSGLEASQLIKANTATADIPIIALTAHAMTSDRGKALAAGCDEFLTKPVNEEAVLKAIWEKLK
jgi:CheY-like chemotaxis protein